MFTKRELHNTLIYIAPGTRDADKALDNFRPHEMDGRKSY